MRVRALRRTAFCGVGRPKWGAVARVTWGSEGQSRRHGTLVQKSSATMQAYLFYRWRWKGGHPTWPSHVLTRLSSRKHEGFMLQMHTPAQTRAKSPQHWTLTSKLSTVDFLSSTATASTILGRLS
eukprot:scaffold155292_cov26-Tisochrysis_lutea.AAC.1